MSQWSDLAEELVVKRYTALVGYASLLTGGVSEAEDLVQDALVATFGRPRRFPSIGHAEAYARRTIASRFVDSRRKLTLRRRRDPVAAPPEASPAKGNTIDLRVDLDRVLLQLPPRQRACLVLRFLADQSTADVAQTLGISEGSVKRYVSDGIAAMGDRLDEEWKETVEVQISKQTEARR